MKKIMSVRFEKLCVLFTGTRINMDYKPSIDPSVSNEFATAGIRALQTALIGRLRLVCWHFLTSINHISKFFHSLAEEETKFTYRQKSTDKLLSEMTNNKYSGRALYYIGKVVSI